MKPMHIAMALLSAAMFFVLAGVFMGVQLELDGTKLVVDTASDVRWQWVFIGTAVVFFFQLLRPAFQKGLKSVSGPKFILPAIDGSTVKQKLFLVALLVLAVAWPFMVSRGTVDIATLTMIYIILGLGLNVVVGLSGLLVLGYGGFYAIGAYTFALLNHYYGLGFWTCLPIAGLMAAAAGFLLGFPVLRLRGDYLAIVTLGFGEIVRILLLNNTEITGGPNGISQIPKPTLFGLEFSRTAREGGWDTFSNFFGLKYDPSDRVIFLYLVALLLVVLSLFVINRLLRMPLGRAWVAATWPALRWLLPPVDLEPSFGCGLPRLSAWRPRLPNVLWHNFIKNVTSMGSFVADRHGIWRAGWGCAGWAFCSPSFCSSPMA